MIRKNSHLRIARYHQHLHELLDLDISPLQYMLKSFPEVKEPEEMRKIIGRYGLTGRQQARTYYNKNEGVLLYEYFNALLIHADMSNQAAKRWSKMPSGVRVFSVASSSPITAR